MILFILKGNCQVTIQLADSPPFNFSESEKRTCFVCENVRHFSFIYLFIFIEGQHTWCK